MAFFVLGFFHLKGGRPCTADWPLFFQCERQLGLDLPDCAYELYKPRGSLPSPSASHSHPGDGEIPAQQQRPRPIVLPFGQSFENRESIQDSSEFGIIERNLQCGRLKDMQIG